MLMTDSEVLLLLLLSIFGLVSEREDKSNSKVKLYSVIYLKKNVSVRLKREPLEEVGCLDI